MASVGTFRVGMRCLISRIWSSALLEVEVMALSPSGEAVKFEPGGWEHVSEWHVVEELDPKEQPVGKNDEPR